MTELVQLRERPRPTKRFALFDKGFRPFFLLAALFALGGVPAWILVRRARLSVGEHLVPTAWHGHEMVFGFAAAVIGGFLLTAASNWTKRVTAVGPALGLLCAVWIAGRVTLLFGGALDPTLIASVNLAFLPLLAFFLARPIIAARSKRNYGLLVVIAGLFAAQALTQAGALRGDVHWQTLGPRLGVGLVTVIVLVIGGRVIPLFTRNAAKVEVAASPLFDRIAIGGAVGVVLLDAAGVRGPALALVAGVTAFAALLRARRWGTSATAKHPLLWVLHLGYLFVPLGFALRAVAALGPWVATSTALHALTAGAIGTLILGMMARVSLGHTGRPLRADRWLTAAFVLVIAAALVRVLGPLLGLASVSLDVSATLWSAAFLIYVVRVGPSLFRERPDGKPG